MVPQLYKQTGPTVSTQQYAGFGARAAAGIGQAIAGAGASLQRAGEKRIARSDGLAASRAWRQMESYQIGYLRQLPERRDELAAISLDDQTGQNVTGYEAELKQYPDRVNAEFERLAEPLSTDARAAFEVRYNAAAPSWADQTTGSLEGLELEDITTEILDLAGSDQVGAASELFEQYRDRYSASDRHRIGGAVIQAAIDARRDAVQDYLQDVARQSGWPAAAELLSDPEFQQDWGLDLDEASGIKADLASFVHDESARQTRLAVEAKEQASDALIADAYEGKLDVTTLAQRIRDDQIEPAVAKAARAIAVNGPPTMNDPDVYQQALAKVNAAMDDPSERAGALSYLRTKTHKLRPATYEQFSAQLYATTDPADPLARPTVKMLARALDDHYEVFGTFGPVGDRASETAYHQAKEQFWDFAKNPDATDEQLNDAFAATMPVAKPSGFWSALWSNLTAIGENSASAASRSGYGDIQPMPAGLPAEPQLQSLGDLVLRPLANPNVEPETAEAFEQTYLDILDPNERDVYYEKWRGKWTDLYK